MCVCGGGRGEKKREGEGGSDSGGSLRMHLSQFIEKLGISCERKKWDRTFALTPQKMGCDGSFSV